MSDRHLPIHEWPHGAQPVRITFHLLQDGEAAEPLLNLNWMSQNARKEVHRAAWETFRMMVTTIQVPKEAGELLDEVQEKAAAVTHKAHHPLPGNWTRRGRAISMEVI